MVVSELWVYITSSKATVEVTAENVLSNPGSYEEIGRKLKGRNYNDSDDNKDSDSDKFMERIKL